MHLKIKRSKVNTCLTKLATNSRRNLLEELLYGQVLVKIDISGICGSQLGEISGAKGRDKYLPHL